MKRWYEGSFQILAAAPASSDEVPEVVFAEWIEVLAESEEEAGERILKIAKRNRWRARRDRAETSVVSFLQLKSREPRVYFGFRYAAATSQTARLHGFSNIDYMPGQLYAFASVKTLDQWVEAGTSAGEIRKAEKVRKLPLGWKASHALDPETEKPSDLVWRHD